MTLSCLVTEGRGCNCHFSGTIGKSRKIPARIAAVVGVWLRLLKQVTDTPGHHLTITALDKAIAFPVRFRQDISNGARQTRFFGNKQPH